MNVTDSIERCSLFFKYDFLLKDEEDTTDRSTDYLWTSVSLDAVKDGRYNIVYTHPEALLSSTKGQALLRSNILEKI